MKVKTTNYQDNTTINGILYKDVNTAIIGTVSFSYNYEVIEFVGFWEDKSQSSQIVYGITKDYLLEVAKRNKQKYVLFKASFTSIYELIDVETEKTIEAYTDFILSGFDDNYSVYDGIKFKLVE